MIKDQAFWISPQGKVKFITNKDTHIGQIIKNPTYFGYTKNMIQDIYNKYNEKLGSEGNAREEIILSLIKKGWIRIRKYNRPDYWSINVPNLNNKIKDALQSWSSYIIKQGEGPYSNVKIDTPMKILQYNVSDLSKDVLYLNENEKIPTKRFLLDFSKGGKRKMYKKFFNETSLSRIWQHVTDSTRSFGVISAYRQDLYSEEKNEERHNQLGKELKSKGYGIIEQKSGYTYKDIKTNKETMVEEKSWFIPRITFKECLVLGKKYDQESVLYKDENGFGLYFCSNGKLDMKFKDKKGIFSFNKNDIKIAYSQLIKANQGQKVKFSYIAEYYIPSMTDAYESLSEKELSVAMWINII